MLQVLDPSERSLADAIDELRDVIDTAYAQVKTARRALATMRPVPELASHLQMAEAELVRAAVAAAKITAEDVAPEPSVAPSLGPVIPFDVESNGGYEYGS